MRATDRPRRPTTIQTLIVIGTLIAVGCSSPVPPSPSPSAPPVQATSSSGPNSTQGQPSPTPALTPPPKVVGDLTLEQCDPAGLLPCEHQAVVITEPIAASGVSLTYSTEWADGRTDRPNWNANALGLGGWALDVLQRYDPEHGILLSGDGSWRIAAAVDIGEGERAVPTYDGFQYFVFDQAWRHTRTVDSVTGSDRLNFGYDATGRLLDVRGHNGTGPIQLTVERDGNGAASGLLGLDGSRTGAVIDPDGQLIGIGRPNGTLMTVEYSDFGLPSRWISTGRGASVFEYDTAGRLARETDADGVSRALAFEATQETVVVTASEASGGVATFRSQRSGDVITRTLTDVDGTVTELETNADGGSRYVQPDGTVATSGAVPHSRWGLAAPVLTPVVETRPDGTEYRVEITSDMGTGSPEPAGGPWRVESVANGSRYVEQYDPQTRTITSTDPQDRAGLRVYDEHGRLIEEHVPGEAPITYAFDDLGRLSSVAVGEAPSAAVTTLSYEGGERIVRRPDGTTLRLRHDEMGNVIGHSTDAENVSLLLDNSGNVMQVRPGNHPATSIGYSEAGRETAFIPPVIDGDDSYESTTYSPAGQVATIDGPGDRRTTISYDAAGRATSWTFDRGTSSATYEPETGLLAANTSPDGTTTTFSYDGSTPVGLAWSGPVTGDVRLSMNALLQPTAETVNGADEITFGYDPAGFLTSINDMTIEREAATGLPIRMELGGVQVVSEYDANGRLVSTSASVRGEGVVELDYTRDAIGRLIGVSRAIGGGAAASVSYEYDASGRVSATDDGRSAETFAYDSAGNRISVSGADGGDVTTATYDDRDRLVTIGDEIFRYSGDGALLERTGSQGTTTFDFDDLGALRSVVLPDGRRVEYVLDAGGRRIGRMVDGVLTDGFLYAVDDTIAAWTNGSGEVVARFAYDDLGRLALVRRDGRDLVVVTDQIGSPIALFDSDTGDLVEEFSYDVWGNSTGATASALIPFGFAGGLVDRDTGLVHFGVRDYDPTVGRWTSSDPLRHAGGDINFYRYANGDPVNRVDPTGTTARAVDTAVAASGDVLFARGGGARRPGGGGVGGGKGVGGGGKTYGDTGPKKPPSGSGQAPGRPNRPSSSGNCLALSFCVPDNKSTYPGRGAPDSVDRPDKPEGLGGPDVFGEPHVVTSDGQHFDFQAAGEFVVGQSADASLRIQARFETPPNITHVTRTTAVAMAVGGDRVAFYTDPVRMTINGEVIERAEYATTLPGGGVVERHGTEATVTWPDGSALRAHVYARFINFGLAPSATIGPSLVGVVGSLDGSRSNDVTSRDGVVLDPEDPSFRELLYGPFANSWRITQEESLFDYAAGESTATFTRPEIPSSPATVESLDEQTRSQAEALCRAVGVDSDPILSDCILDFGVTGDPSYVASAIIVATERERIGSVLDLGTRMNLGETVTGQLAAGTTDRYHFTAAAGDIVYLDAGDTCDPALDWRLSRPDGRLTAFALACNEIGRRVLDGAGEWLIDVYSDEASAGAYSFTVLPVPQPPAEPIAPGESVSGTTIAAGEWHRYTLNASAGQVVYLDAEGSCESPVWWRLFRPNTVLATFDRACADLGRRVLDVDGEWVIEIYADDLSTGPYAFRVIDVPPARESSIRAGDTVADATTRVGEWHRYKLAATAGDVVFLDAVGECVPGLFWRILQPSQILRTFANTCSDMGRVVLDTPGDWIIEVYADDFAFGAYSFHVIGAPPVRTGSLTLGQNVTDTIAAIGEWHRYTLSAQAGQRIVIDAQGECVPDLWWRLIRPDGVLSTFASTCTDSDARTLDVAGDWVIEIYSDVMATGAYSFTVNAAP